MTDHVKLYNPANAASLTQEQIEGLQKLTSPEIKELATAYPNMVMQRAYLLIIDSTKSPAKQLPTLSTFENLWNLREKNAQRNFVAFGFRGNFKQVQPLKAKRTDVLDLSETELMSLPGFKTATKEHPPQEVKVTKINKLIVPGEGGVKEVINIPVKDFKDFTKSKKVPANKKSNIK